MWEPSALIRSTLGILRYMYWRTATSLEFRLPPLYHCGLVGILQPVTLFVPALGVKNDLGEAKIPYRISGT